LSLVFYSEAEFGLVTVFKQHIIIVVKSIKTPWDNSSSNKKNKCIICKQYTLVRMSSQINYKVPTFYPAINKCLKTNRCKLSNTD